MSGGKTVTDQWLAFERGAIAAGVEPALRKNARHCFYAGATGMYVLLTTELEGLSEVEMAARLHRWKDELAEYFGVEVEP